MTNAKGTLELIALELTKLLQPLKDNLTPDRAAVTLEELGFSLSQAQVTSIATPLTATIASTTDLISKSQELITAINADNEGDIISKAIDIIVDIKNVITGFADIKNALSGLGLAGITPAMINAFPENLFDYLAVNYLNNLQGVNPALAFLGILEQTEENVGSVDPNKPPYTFSKFHFDQVGGWLSSPADQFKSLYKWGDPAFDGKLLFAKLADIFSRLGFPVYYDDTAAVPKLDMVLLEAVAKTDIDPKGISIGLNDKISTGTQSFNGDDWKLNYKVDFDPPTDTKLIIQPGGNMSFVPPSGSSSISGDLLLDLIVKKTAQPGPYIILGQTGGSRLEVLQFELKTGTTLSWSAGKADGNFSIEGAATQCKIIINAGEGDGFIQKILPNINFEADFDLGIGVSTQHGVYLQGSAALEIKLPVHIDLGPISLEGLTITLKLKDGKFPIELGADIKASLGPLVAVVQNMGVTATFSFPPNNTGNLGPLQLDMGFKPPNGVGLSIDTGIIKGGGFLYLDFDKGEYFGALELEVEDLFSLKAVGIINTKMPDGSSGFSLLIIITADFTPIQLGFGFTLNGVGGLLGLNRTMVVDVLRQGIKTNAIKSVLFPQDVVANINRIVSDLKQIFPPYEGHFIVGPMAELGWAEIITLEIGILIEIPAPKIAILGVIKAILPTEDAALLKIQINFLGVIDFDNKYISFDASLYDSSLLIFTLTGDMAFRLSWGDHPYFLLSVGGFHPAFKDAPADLQHMVRLGISLMNNDYLKVSVTCYFAVTSNTVQFGAKVELYAGVSAFNVYGYLGFDVLFQFDPFKFIADIYAGLALRSGTSVLMGITLSGELSGPGPWNIKGEASFTILFFSISVHVDTTWGDNQNIAPKQAADLIQMLTDAINDNRNWKADIPDANSQHVSIKSISLTGPELIIHPFGILTFSERIVPLGVDITRFGNEVPKDAHHFDITTTDPGVITANATEQFASANFFDLTDAQKLSHPSFEPLKSGFKITGDSSLLTPPGVITKDVDYRLTYLRANQPLLRFKGLYGYAKGMFQTNLQGNAVAKSSLSNATNRVSLNSPDPVTVTGPQYAIAHTADLTMVDTTLLSGSYTDSNQQYQNILKTRPELAGQIQIVHDYELNSN